MSLNAFVTLVTTDSYVPGALVTVHSVLEAEGPNPANPFETVCLVTPATLSVQSIKALRRNFSLVVGVEEIRSGSSKELQLLGRQDLASTLTKLHLFRLIQFRKVIFLDADTLALQPLSHLFGIQEPFSAAPDSGWPDCFNSGMFVATPSAETFDALMAMSSERGSWDGGDQGLLNDFFPNWNRLSFTYNVTPSAYYTYAPAYRRHGQDIKLVHFIGAHKPWHEPGPSRSNPATSESGGASDYASLVNKWFSVYQRYFSKGGAQSTFTFPTLQATWDAPKGKITPYTPPSLEDLKKTFQGVFSSSSSPRSVVSTANLVGNAVEGHYVSMPLKAGRPDLTGNIVFSPPRDKTPTPPKEPSPIASPALPGATEASSSQSAPTLAAPPSIQVNSPTPEQTPAQTRSPSPPVWQAPNVNWDPARSGPPKDDRPQMEGGFDQQYDNVWDAPKSPSQRSFFKAPATYGAIPKVTYQDYGKVTQGKPYSPPWQDEIKPIFPWEQRGDKPKATSRVFPVEPVKKVRVQAPAPPSNPPSGLTMPTSAVPTHAPVTPSIQQAKGTPFSTAGFTSAYTNAWDDVAAIRRYANNLQGGPKKPNGGNGQQDRPKHSRNASDIGPSSHAHHHSHARSGSTASGASGSGHIRGGSSASSHIAVSSSVGGSTGGSSHSSPRKEGYETEESSRDGDDEEEEDEDDEEGLRGSKALSTRAGARGTRSPPQARAARNVPVQSQSAATAMKREGSHTSMTNPPTAAEAADGGSPIGRYSRLPQMIGARIGSRTPSSESLSKLPDPSNGSYKSTSVSRVFDPKTGTDVIRKEGLEALHRFVRSMEAKGAAVNHGRGNGSLPGSQNASAQASVQGSPTSQR